MTKTPEQRKAAKKASQQKYQEANREKILARQREYNSRPESIARRREYYEKKRREQGIPARAPKMTDEERILKERERSRLYAEKKRREAGVPVRTRMSDEEQRVRRSAQAAAYREKNLEKCRERNRLHEERKRRARGVPEMIKFADEAAKRKHRRDELKKWRLEHKDRYKDQYMGYRKKNAEKINARRLEQYWADPDKARNRSLISQLANDLKVAPKDLPQDLVQAKLALVQVQRKVKELKL
jgi:hypothetical protein